MVSRLRGLRQTAHQNIQLQNLRISDSHKHGIYLDRYVHHVTIENGAILPMQVIVRFI